MRLLLFLVLFLCSFQAFSQKEANIWYFGRNAGLDFSTSPPTAIEDGQLSTFEGCSSIADVNGDLLFYSDGITVWNKNHEIMNYSNGNTGDNLLGNPSSTQSGLIVPNPTDTNIYYLFTVGDVGERGFWYYTIDISKNNGLGEIIDGPVELNNDGANGVTHLDWTEKVTAVIGDECNTFWVISYAKGNFYSHKVSGTGVESSPVVSTLNNSSFNISPIFINTQLDPRGYLKVSPDGTKLVSANSTSGTFLFDFDSATGMVSNPIDLNIGNDGYGVEFSQSSQKLYITTGNHSQGSSQASSVNIYQFDLSANDIINSRELIYNGTGFRGALQLGLDGKIYYAKSRETSLGVINFPDNSASEVEYIHDGISLGSKVSTEGLPPFIQSFFAPTNIVNSDDVSSILNSQTKYLCVNESITIEPELQGLPGSVYTWTLESDGSVVGNSRQLTIDANTHGSDTYHLEMQLMDDCGRSLKYNSSITVEFKDLPIVKTVSVYEQCDFDNNPADGITQFNLSSKIPELFDNTENLIIEFFEVSDTNFTSPIQNTDSYTNIISTNTNNHKLIVRATINGANNSYSCEGFGEIELKANATSPAFYKNEYLSEIDLNESVLNPRYSMGSDNAYFDFNNKTQEIIDNSNGAFSLNSHSFEYYLSSTDASLQNNQIIAPFTDYLFNNDTDIFVRVVSKSDAACEGIGQFKIYINKRPIPVGLEDPQYLCINNPRDNPQLNTIDLDASTGVANDEYQWFLNGNIIKGATEAIHKATEEGKYYVEAYRYYENNVQDPDDDSITIGYNTFDVLESNIAVIDSISIEDDLANPKANILNIKVSGIGNYWYSINSTNISDYIKGNTNLSHTFNNIQPGINTVYIWDSNGCGTAKSAEYSFIHFQRFFTPNQDGVYDTWNVLGTNNDFYKTIRVDIFDRYGKLIYAITNKDSRGWDGTYNGKILQEDGFWYKAVLEDQNGKLRTQSGHFSLIRN